MSKKIASSLEALAAVNPNIGTEEAGINRVMVLEGERVTLAPLAEQFRRMQDAAARIDGIVAEQNVIQAAYADLRVGDWERLVTGVDVQEVKYIGTDAGPLAAIQVIYADRGGVITTNLSSAARHVHEAVARAGEKLPFRLLSLAPTAAEAVEVYLDGKRRGYIRGAE